MPNELTLIERLAFSTVRIVAEMANGQFATGTGFFYVAKEVNGQILPVIITNKHVIKDSVAGHFTLTLQKSDGTPDMTNHTTFVVDQFEQRWVNHPNPEVDLCAMPIAQLIHLAQEQKKQLYYRPFDKALLPTDLDLDDILGIDDIVMIGYPNGIWDETNNLPVFRKGITATNPKYDWNGKKEFLIDCACFPGSSGSPILLLNIGGYISRNRYMVGASRVKLLGILYSGTQHTATGEIEIITAPTVERPVAISHIPNNLGIVIKSERLNDFATVFGDP